MDLLIFNTNPKFKDDGQFVYEFPNGDILYSKEKAEEIVKQFNKVYPNLNFVVTTISAFLLEVKNNNWFMNISKEIFKNILVCTILYPDIFSASLPIFFEFVDDVNIKFIQGGVMDKHLENEMAINN